MKIPRLFAALPLLLAGYCATASAADKITTPEQLIPQLDAMLKHAIAQSPRMISRSIDLEMADEARVSARSGLLPSVGGYFSYVKSQDDRADLDASVRVTKVSYSFSLNQPLFYWGERRNNDKMGEIRRVMATGQYREGYRLFAQEVRAQYLHLVVAKLLTVRSARYREYTANQAKQGEDRLAKKVISDAQMFALRMEAERTQISAERYVFDYENSKNAFAQLTGTAVLKDEEIPDSIPPVEAQTDRVQALLAGFLAQKDPPTLDAVSFLQQLDLERLNLANQKTRLKPKFNFTLGASQDQQTYTVNVAAKYQVNSYFAGVSGNWTLFDGFSAGAGKRTALARIRQLETDYRGLTERLAQQAQSQARLIEFDARYASINDRLLTSGESNLNLRKEEFKRGVISEDAVTTAQMGLYEAQLNAYVSRADYYTQVGEFLGTVVEDPVLANLSVK